MKNRKGRVCERVRRRVTDKGGRNRVAKIKVNTKESMK